MPLLLGLDFMSKKKIVHRDIKPANVLFEKTKDGTIQPYLCDFGLAEVIP